MKNKSIKRTLDLEDMLTLAHIDSLKETLKDLKKIDETENFKDTKDLDETFEKITSYWLKSYEHHFKQSVQNRLEKHLDHAYKDNFGL